MCLLYYTNNLLSPELLTKTVEEVLTHGESTNSEVLIISHYPVLDNHINLHLNNLPLMQFFIAPMKQKMDKSSIYNHLTKVLAIPARGDCKNYVVGQHPYNPTTIIQQLDAASELCNSDAVILMEHDCFYPEDYVDVCRRVLDAHDAARCINHRCYCTVDGYLRYQRFFLNGLAMRLKPFKQYIENKKKQLWMNKRLSYLEPYVEGLEVLSDGFEVKSYADVDGLLGEDHDLLDLQHGLNYYQCLHVSSQMRSHIIDSHPFWGDAGPYIDLIKTNMLSKSEKVLCFCGVQELEL